MVEINDRQISSRVQGRQAIERRLRALLIAATRFGERRASAKDRLWAGAVADAITALLDRDTAGGDRG